MILEKRKLVFRALVKKGDKVGAINELISIIKANYENVKGEFQSMYDHHEILISMLIGLAKDKGVSINQDYVASLLDSKAIPEDGDIFKKIQSESAEEIQNTINNLYASFMKYNIYELD